MRELVRTNDVVLVSAIGALLDGANIHHLVLDQNMSIIEGSLGIIPRRILVHEDDNREARQMMIDAGLGHELRADVEAAAEFSEDGFLDGRLMLRQPRKGHRAGHDAMLLAASTFAQPGNRVVEFGAGVGAVGLALATRVPGLDLVLVEIDPVLAQLAQDNAVLNGITARAVTLDVATGADAFAAVGLLPDSADAVMMNPPFNDAAQHRASPDLGRAKAHVANPAMLADWVYAVRRSLKSGGTLTMIWRADGLAEVLAGLDRGFGSVVIQPVHATTESPAIRVLLRASKGGRAPLRLLPGLVLTSDEVRAALLNATALPLGSL